MSQQALLENPKLFTLEEALEKRVQLRASGGTFILTNGCFDLLHCGHIYFLNEAAKHGDELWIALNSDSSVQSLKGPRRPIQNQWQRAYALASLSSVKGIVIFDSKRLVKEIETLKPDMYVKAGDYNIESINQAERNALQDCETKIEFLGFLEGFSTTTLLEKIQSA